MRAFLLILLETLLTPTAARATNIQYLEREMQERQRRALEAARVAKLAQDRAVQEAIRRSGHVFGRRSRDEFEEAIRELRFPLPPVNDNQ